MGKNSDVRLDAFREAIVEEARQEAQEELERVKRDAERKIEDARGQAEEWVDEARRQGREAAERETRRRRSEARREAREQILRARTDALEELRRRAMERIRRDEGGSYQQFMDQIRTLAREQLGEGAEIEEDAEAGGLVARSDGRLVDYRLPAVLDRVFEEMGIELEELWHE